MTLRIKDWNEFQHYKTRNPPWIKLHKKLLDDPEFHALSGDASKTLAMCWLIASENNGYLPAIEKLAFRLRIDSTMLAKHLIELKHWLVDDDSLMLAERLRDACLETETETEKKDNPPNPLSPAQPEPPPDFSEFWKTYPKNLGSEVSASKAYELARRQGATHSEIIIGARIYAQFVKQNGTDPEFVTQASNWLKEKKWTVDYQLRPSYTPMHPGAGG